MTRDDAIERVLFAGGEGSFATLLVRGLETLGLIEFDEFKVCKLCSDWRRCKSLGQCAGELNKEAPLIDAELRRRLHGKSIYTHTSGMFDFVRTDLNNEMIDGFADLVARAGFMFVKKP